jgi:hypothetical protein
MSVGALGAILEEKVLNWNIQRFTWRKNHLSYALSSLTLYFCPFNFMPIPPVTYDIPAVAKQFAMAGDLQGFQPCGHGLINDTYEVRYNQGGVAVRYVIQRINHHVFQHPELVMDNIVRVTTHIGKKLAGAGGEDIARRVLTLVPARNGKLWQGLCVHRKCGCA